MGLGDFFRSIGWAKDGKKLDPWFSWSRTAVGWRVEGLLVFKKKYFDGSKLSRYWLKMLSLL